MSTHTRLPRLTFWTCKSSAKELFTKTMFVTSGFGFEEKSYERLTGTPAKKINRSNPVWQTTWDFTAILFDIHNRTLSQLTSVDSCRSRFQDLRKKTCLQPKGLWLQAMIRPSSMECISWWHLKKYCIHWVRLEPLRGPLVQTQKSRFWIG